MVRIALLVYKNRCWEKRVFTFTAVVLMEGGDNEDLERLAKLADEEAEEEEGEVDAKSKGTLAGLIDTSVKPAAKSTATAAPKSPSLSKKVSK